MKREKRSIVSSFVAVPVPRLSQFCSCELAHGQQGRVAGAAVVNKGFQRPHETWVPTAEFSRVSPAVAVESLPTQGDLKLAAYYVFYLLPFLSTLSVLCARR